MPNLAQCFRFHECRYVSVLGQALCRQGCRFSPTPPNTSVFVQVFFRATECSVKNLCLHGISFWLLQNFCCLFRYRGRYFRRGNLFQRAEIGFSVFAFTLPRTLLAALQSCHLHSRQLTSMPPNFNSVLIIFAVALRISANRIGLALFSCSRRFSHSHCLCRNLPPTRFGSVLFCNCSHCTSVESLPLRLLLLVYQFRYPCLAIAIYCSRRFVQPPLHSPPLL